MRARAIGEPIAPRAQARRWRPRRPRIERRSHAWAPVWQRARRCVGAGDGSSKAHSARTTDCETPRLIQRIPQSCRAACARDELSVARGELVVRRRTPAGVLVLAEIHVVHHSKFPVVLRCAAGCYNEAMKPNESIPIRTLRNDVSQVIKRVERGEAFDVTRHDRVVASLGPPSEPRRPGTLTDLMRLRRAVPVDHDFLDLIRQLRSDTRDPYERIEEPYRP